MNRSFAASDAKRDRNEKSQYAGLSFFDLPKNIQENILMRLSLRMIILCKSVCKTWYDLISDPEFAKLHFDEAQICALIRRSGATYLSRMVYVVQPEHFNVKRKLELRDYLYPDLICLDSVKIKLDTKLKLPLRNLRKILVENNGSDHMLNSESGRERDNCIKLKMRDHNYSVVNSCNGLLCLSTPSNNEPVIVCNPVTGEFVNLPEPKTNNISKLRTIACGLGFSSTSNQYKVIRMFSHRNWIPANKVLGAQVHILGTESWKDLDCYPESSYIKFPTNFNGCIYWLSFDSMTYFDIEKECFGLLKPLENMDRCSYETIGVLGGELCISQADPNSYIHIWVQKDDGARKNWCKVLSFETCLKFGIQYRGWYVPIMYLNNGELLMFHSRKKAFMFVDPRKSTFRYFKVQGMDSNVEAFAHIPTFRSLKDVLPGCNVEVLNIYSSRCARLKLHNEAKCISLIEENMRLRSDSEKDIILYN